MVRKHIKVEPARWYYHCDRHGLVVWQDMINGGSKWNVFYQEQVRPLVDKGVSAVVYTQLTDVETEINGLMTYDREVVKMDISFLNSLNKELSDCLP